MASKTGPSEAAPPAAPGPDALVRAAAARLVGELSSRRWFGAKARAIAAVTPLDYTAVPATGGVLALFRVDFTAGPPETYCIPLLAQAIPGATAWIATDAMDDPAFCAALVEQIR